MTVSTPVTGYITRIVFLSCEAGQHTSSSEYQILSHIPQFFENLGEKLVYIVEL